MSETAEIFQDMRAYRKEKQKQVGNKWAEFMTTLDQDLLQWKSMYHCRIEHGTLRVDVWPTSGRFWIINSLKSQHGLDKFRELLALHNIHGRASTPDARHTAAEIPAQSPILQPVRPDSEPAGDTSMSPF